MSWEERAGRHYYYKKRRINGRVVSEYVGIGLLAQLAADLAELDIQRRKFERDQRRAEFAEATKLDSLVDEFTRRVNQIVEAVLLATGHHQHRRQWRKKRVSNITLPDGFGEALDRIHANKPKKGDIAIVQKYIREIPNGWMVYGDLYRNTITATLDVMAGQGAKGELLTTSLMERLKALQADFGYKAGSPLERLLIEQICICWLRLWWLENIFSQNYEKMSLSNTLLYEKRLALNQARFNRAVETLARVRRLARRTPEVLQVNIGAQQVNQVTG